VGGWSYFLAKDRLKATRGVIVEGSKKDFHPDSKRAEIKLYMFQRNSQQVIRILLREHQKPNIGGKSAAEKSIH